MVIEVLVLGHVDLNMMLLMTMEISLIKDNIHLAQKI